MEASITMSEIWAEYIETRRSELRDELITAYAPFVRFVVGRMGIPPTTMLDFEDLMGYGMIGLINAIDRYDPARGVPFEPFATSRIRGAVIDQLRQLNWLPRSAMTRVRQIQTSLATLEQRLGRPAREEEAAEEMGVSTDRYRQMLVEVSGTMLSLNVPIGAASEDDESTLSDLLEDESSPSPEDVVEREELANALTEAIDRLPQREQLLLSLYYKEELTMKEISKVMGISESRVCQLHMQAVMRLRGSMHSFDPSESRTTGTRKVAVSNTRKSHHGVAAKKSDSSEVVAGAHHQQRVS
jgi:RNA polymerase sigma factor for flagellar operon FliA